MKPISQKSRLSQHKKREIFNCIHKLMSSNRPYLDSDITIDKFAKRINTNRQYLSIVINEFYSKNFSNFINEFRINDAIEIIKLDENMKYTIEGISGSVGFSNRTSFIKSFKLVTNMTPSEFRKSVLKS